jgi:hypothetical protein
VTAQPDALEQLRVEIAQEHGLGRDGAQFLTGTTLQEIETQAAQLRKVLDAGGPQREPEPVAPTNLLAELRAERLARKRALAEMLTGRSQPRDEAGRFVSSAGSVRTGPFDGGARGTPVVASDPLREHDQLVAGLIAARRIFGGSDF